MDHQRLREIRTVRNLTQLELAVRIGVAPQQVYRWEKGENDPTGDVIAKLARELRVTSDYLLGLVDKPHEYVVTPTEIDPLAFKVDTALKSGDSRMMAKVMTELINTAWRLKGNHADTAPSS